MQIVLQTGEYQNVKGFGRTCVADYSFSGRGLYTFLTSDHDRGLYIIKNEKQIKFSGVSGIMGT